jgi:hypothetical protein
MIAMVVGHIHNFTNARGWIKASHLAADSDAHLVVQCPEQCLIGMRRDRDTPVRRAGDVPVEIQMLALCHTATLDDVVTPVIRVLVLDDKCFANTVQGVATEVVIADLDAPAGVDGLCEVLNDGGLDNPGVSVHDRDNFNRPKEFLLATLYISKKGLHFTGSRSEVNLRLRALIDRDALIYRVGQSRCFI